MREFAASGGKLRRRRGVVAACVAAVAAVSGLVIAVSAGTRAPSAAAKEASTARAMFADALPPATIKARQHYFGLDNVDPRTGAVRSDRVILSWAGVSTFAAAFNGHVVLLDAWVPRGPSTTWNHSVEYVGTTPQELAALAPEAYFIGHFHGDHGYDAPAIVEANPDMAVYGNQNHCDDLRAQVRERDPRLQVNCFAVFPSVEIENGRPVPSSFGMVDNLPPNTVPGVCISAVMHPHSLRPDDPEADPPFNTMQVTKRPCVAFDQYPPDPNEPERPPSPPSGIIAIAWQFRIGDFALTWSDSNGPDVGARTAQAWASLPPTDVYFGAIAVSGRSVLNEGLAQIRPKVYAPIHHDPCANDVYREVRDQLATIPAASRPQLLYLSDPADYLKPIVFDPSAEAWKANGVSESGPRPPAPATATMTPAAPAPAPAPAAAAPAAPADTVLSVPVTKSTARGATTTATLNVRIAKARGSRLSVRIRGIPAAGRLKVKLSATRGKQKVALGSASRTLKRAGAATLTVRLSKSARKLLAARRSVKASLKLTYTASGSRATTVSRVVRISR